MQNHELGDVGFFLRAAPVGNSLVGNLWFGHTNQMNMRTHFYAQSHGNMRANDRSISDLIPLSMSHLYFSSCNTANLDFTVNLMTAFFNHNSGISAVTGWDGGVGFTFFSRRRAVQAFVIGTVSGGGIRGVQAARAWGNVNQDGASPWDNQHTFRSLMDQTGNIRNPGAITLRR